MLTRDEIESIRMDYYIFNESEAEVQWLEQICNQAILAIELQAKLNTQPQVTNYDLIAELKAENRILKDIIVNIEVRCTQMSSMADDHAWELADDIADIIGGYV